MDCFESCQDAWTVSRFNINTISLFIIQTLGIWGNSSKYCFVLHSNFSYQYGIALKVLELHFLGVLWKGLVLPTVAIFEHGLNTIISQLSTRVDMFFPSKSYNASTQHQKYLERVDAGLVTFLMSLVKTNASASLHDHAPGIYAR